jgi:hypothetical protein
MFRGGRTKNFFCRFCFVPKNHKFFEECLIDENEGKNVFTSLSNILNFDLNDDGEDDDNDPSTHIDLNKRCGEHEIRDTFFVSQQMYMPYLSSLVKF